MKKDLLLGTAIILTLTGIASPAFAQQYLEHFKTSAQSSVQVDMGALDNAKVPQQPAPASQGMDTSADVAMPAVSSAPEKTLSNPLFTQMSPTAITGKEATAKTPPAQKRHNHTVASKKKHRLAAQPQKHRNTALLQKPRHKPQTATVSLDNEQGNAPVAQASAVQQPILMLSLPSHMPKLAVDDAKMPPLGTASPLVPPPAQEPALAPQEMKVAPIAAPATRPALQKITAVQTPAIDNHPAPISTATPKPQSDSLMPSDSRAETEAQVEDAQADMQRALGLQDKNSAANAGTVQKIPPAPATPTQNDANALPVVPTLADLTLSFTGNSSDLSPDAQRKLDSIVNQLNGMQDGRIQVRGFATGENGGQASARRISLSRVLSVRSYLMDKGIKPARVDVRAQGADTDRQPLDRVDLLFEH